MQLRSKSFPSTSAFASLNHDRLVTVTDGLATALAASLPWSTSLTGIFAALWLVALIPTIEPTAIRRELGTCAGGLPVLLFALGAIGMLWANVPLAERLHGLDSYVKLLFIPLLILHFRRSTRGVWVLKGFLISCIALLVFSWATAPFPSLIFSKHGTPGVPVKDYISQSALFTICIAITLEFMIAAWRETRRKTAVLFALLALAFTANIFYIATSRTALVFLPVLIALFSFKRVGWREAVILFAVLIGLTTVASQSSDFFRQRVYTLFEEISDYRATDARTSAGERLEFWKKSLEIIATAPIIGHGTGTIRQQFSLLASGADGTSSLVAENPHNQTFAVAIQLGLLGTVALYAMRLAHLLLFRRQEMAAWIGLVVVAQNIVGSLFNSHLFDFTQGWGYVIGVGVAGGVVIAQAQMQESNK